MAFGFIAKPVHTFFTDSSALGNNLLYGSLFGFDDNYNQIIIRVSGDTIYESPTATTTATNFAPVITILPSGITRTVSYQISNPNGFIRFGDQSLASVSDSYDNQFPDFKPFYNLQTIGVQDDVTPVSFSGLSSLDSRSWPNLQRFVYRAPNNSQIPINNADRPTFWQFSGNTNLVQYQQDAAFIDDGSRTISFSGCTNLDIIALNLHTYRTIDLRGCTNLRTISSFFAGQYDCRLARYDTLGCNVIWPAFRTNSASSISFQVRGWGLTGNTDLSWATNCTSISFEGGHNLTSITPPTSTTPTLTSFLIPSLTSTLFNQITGSTNGLITWLNTQSTLQTIRLDAFQFSTRRANQEFGLLNFSNFPSLDQYWANGNNHGSSNDLNFSSNTSLTELILSNAIFRWFIPDAPDSITNFSLPNAVNSASTIAGSGLTLNVPSSCTSFQAGPTYATVDMRKLPSGRTMTQNHGTLQFFNNYYLPITGVTTTFFSGTFSTPALTTMQSGFTSNFFLPNNTFSVIADPAHFYDFPLGTNIRSNSIAIRPFSSATHLDHTINNLFDFRGGSNINSLTGSTGFNNTVSKTLDVNSAGVPPTGTLTTGSTGTYGGLLFNLTETEVNNLAAGLDFNGLGSNTPWSPREKIWWLVNAQVSSVNTTLRYKWTINTAP